MNLLRKVKGFVFILGVFAAVFLLPAFFKLDSAKAGYTGQYQTQTTYQSYPQAYYNTDNNYQYADYQNDNGYDYGNYYNSDYSRNDCSNSCYSSYPTIAYSSNSCWYYNGSCYNMGQYNNNQHYQNSNYRWVKVHDHWYLLVYSNGRWHLCQTRD